MKRSYCQLVSACLLGSSLLLLLLIGTLILSSVTRFHLPTSEEEQQLPWFLPQHVHHHIKHKVIRHQYVQGWYFNQRRVLAKLSQGQKTYSTGLQLIKSNSDEWDTYQQKCNKYVYRVWYVINETTVSLWVRPVNPWAKPGGAFREGCRQLAFHPHLGSGNKLYKKIREVINNKLPPRKIRETQFLYFGKRKFQAIANAYNTASPNRKGDDNAKFDVAGNNANDFILNMLTGMNFKTTSARKKWIINRYTAIASDQILNDIKMSDKYNGNQNLAARDVIKTLINERVDEL